MPVASANGHPVSEQKLERLLVEPLAIGYRPTLPIEGMMGVDGNPGFYLYRDLEVMQTHPRVSSVMTYYRSGIAGSEVEIKADGSDVGQYVFNEWNKFWTRSLAQIQRSYEYGWDGYEICYEVDRGWLNFDHLIDFAPRDVVVLARDHRYAGIRVNDRAKGNVELWGPDGDFPDEVGHGETYLIPRNVPPKGFWFAHQPRFNSFYGRSQLYGAWRPWRRLAANDGAEQVIDGGIYRFAYQGPEIGYPNEDYRDATGKMINCRDIARNLSESAKAGVSIVWPSTHYPPEQGGGPKWYIKFPASAIEVSGLLEYAKYLEDQICYGAGVPPELMEAADTGSGYSGRRIPLEAFLMGQQVNADAIAKAFVDQIAKPLVAWNFGTGRRFELTVKSLLKTKMETTGTDGSGKQSQPAPGQKPEQRGGEVLPGKIDNGQQQPPKATPTQLSTDQPRAPVGGSVVDGKPYDGGEFVPKDAAKESQSAVTAKLKSSKKRSEAAAILKEHGKKLVGEEKSRVDGHLPAIDKTLEDMKPSWVKSMRSVNRVVRHMAKQYLREYQDSVDSRFFDLRYAHKRSEVVGLLSDVETKSRDDAWENIEGDFNDRFNEAFLEDAGSQLHKAIQKADSPEQARASVNAITGDNFLDNVQHGEAWEDDLMDGVSDWVQAKAAPINAAIQKQLKQMVAGGQPKQPEQPNAAKEASAFNTEKAHESVRKLLDGIGATTTTAKLNETLDKITQLSKTEIDALLVKLNIHGKMPSKAKAADAIRTVVNQQMQMETKAQGFFNKPIGTESTEATSNPVAKAVREIDAAQSMSAIPQGDARHINGWFVKRVGDNEYRIETDKGHVQGTADKIAERVAREWQDQRADQKRIDAALKRAESHAEPDLFTDPGRVEAETEAFEELPVGTRVVSLDPKTHGRLGTIVRKSDTDAGGKSVHGIKVKLDGSPEPVSSHVEPLDEKLSWRAKREKATAPKDPEVRQGMLFSMASRFLLERKAVAQ